MIRIRLMEMMEAWSLREGSRLTLSVLAKATDIHRVTLWRMVSQPDYNAELASVDRLCEFFGCRIEELVVHESRKKTPRDRRSLGVKKPS